MQTAIDASRHVFTPRAHPTPQPVIDAFAAFISVLSNDRRRTVKLSVILNVAKVFFRGATSG